MQKDDSRHREYVKQKAVHNLDADKNAEKADKCHNAGTYVSDAESGWHDFYSK